MNSKKSSIWAEKTLTFFTHKQCAYFPCHDIEEADDFNCLFCYCPLYGLGDACGGNFYINEGIKDCSKCLISHKKQYYYHIVSKIRACVLKSTINEDEIDNR